MAFDQLLHRRGTAAQWTSANPTLGAGELGYETDTGKFKMGDGATAWNAIASYFQPGAGGSGGGVTSVGISVSGSGLSVAGSPVTSSGVISLTVAAALSAIGALTPASDRIPYYTGVSAAALTTLTAFGRSLIDDADAATARGTLGLVIGTDVQAYNANLATIAGLSAVNDDFLQRKAGAWTNRTVAQVKTDLGLTGTNSGDQTIALTGDVTGSGTGFFAATIASGAVSLGKMANLAANSIIGNNTGAAATPVALSQTQVTAILNTFTTTLQGVVPASGGGTTNFLRADGTWAAPGGGGSGDVVGPASATDNAIARFDGTTGKLVQNSAVTVADTTGAIAFLSDSTSISLGASSDVILRRYAANALEVRNGTNPQSLYLPNTWTDASNNEYGFARWRSNRFEIGTQVAGTGTIRYPYLFNQAKAAAYNAQAGIRLEVDAGSSAKSLDFQYNGGYRLLWGIDGTMVGSFSPEGIGLGSGFVGWNNGVAGNGADVAMTRNAAGVAEINNGTAATFRDLRVRHVRPEPTVVASLISAATAGKGALAYVTDATATTPRSTVAGGGANEVLVMSNGANWIIIA